MFYLWHLDQVDDAGRPLLPGRTDVLRLTFVAGHPSFGGYSAGFGFALHPDEG